jgi:cold shock CspA family protein
MKIGEAMQVPPEIILKGVKTTPFVEKLIDRGIAGLEQVCDNIVSTRIALEQAQARHQTGNPYRMRISVRIPGRPEIVVKRWSKGLTRTPDGLAKLETEIALEEETESKRPPVVRRSPLGRKVREEPLVALIRRTFNSAQRELKRAVDKQRGEVKTPANVEAMAVVERILRDQGYGFLRTPEGEQVYFHRNSVLHNHWQELTAGTTVRYTGELGEKGLQASTVEPVEKPGAAEAHDQLHGLPGTV